MGLLTEKCYSKDENDRYMYYTGTASGIIYRREFDARIWELCQTINTLTWQEQYKINQYFVKSLKKN